MSAIAVAALASCVARSFSPSSGDHVLVDEAGQIVITSSGFQMLEVLAASVHANPVVTIAVKSAVTFGKLHGVLACVLLSLVRRCFVLEKPSCHPWLAALPRPVLS